MSSIARHDGLSAQHIITLGWRGALDARIRERLEDDQVVFLTQDVDFLLVRQVARSSSCRRKAVQTFERTDRGLASLRSRTPPSIEARTALRTDGQRRALAVARHIKRHLTLRPCRPEYGVTYVPGRTSVTPLREHVERLNVGGRKTSAIERGVRYQRFDQTRLFVRILRNLRGIGGLREF
jgi:hypothetical protein